MTAYSTTREHSINHNRRTGSNRVTLGGAMKNRTLATAAAATALVTVLAACGNSTSTAGGSTTADAKG